MKKLNFIEKLSICLAGYDTITANNCTSSEIRKICVIGSMVLLPGLIGLFSYGYGFYFIFNTITFAVAGGILSSIVLVLIDRSIMAFGRPGQFSFGILGRIFLAITAGFLLAEPLVLRIFQDSIDEQLYAELQQQKSIAAIPYQNQIGVLQKDLQADEQRLNVLQAAYTGEADGTSGSLIRNQGPIYKMKLNDYNNAKTAYDLKTAKVVAEIDDINNKEAVALRSIENNQANKLIGRMRALTVLGDKEPIVKWTTWLLRLFFCLIECLPLMIKISPTGDRGLYYRLVDLADKEREETYIMSSEERKVVKQQEEKLRYTQQYAELCMKETQIIASSKEKDTVYLMDKATAISEKKLDFITKATKNIKDPELLQVVINHLNQIHQGFMSTIEILLSKSNKNFGTNNI